MKRLTENEWVELRKQHVAIIRPYTEGFRERRSRQKAHPIYDFLFIYYTYSSNKLEQWHPGFNVSLEVSDYMPPEWQNTSLYHRNENTIKISLIKLNSKNWQHILKIGKLCRQILATPSRFSCFGLHEWAMLYKTDETRHKYPLRLSPSEIDRVLEENTYCCSHFDAFRFSTNAAKPLNIIQPTSDTRLQYEQSGCLHSNMDLYKWCYKLIPLISSELLKQCFLLALETRELDMQASPYDFSTLGFPAIPIETIEGREEYATKQRSIAERAQALRAELFRQCQQLLTFAPKEMTFKYAVCDEKHEEGKNADI